MNENRNFNNNESMESAAMPAASYPKYDWSNGIYLVSTREAAFVEPQYSFVPTGNYLYFNAQVTGVNEAPAIHIFTLDSKGETQYLTGVPLLDSGNGVYELDNKRQSLNAGVPYVVRLSAESGNWKTGKMEIFNKSFD